jgi:acyl-CoA reductase-like NAD-dependent aldehyde dehydrogenase
VSEVEAITPPAAVLGERQLLIGGAWTAAGGDRFAVVDPSTEAELGTLAQAEEADVDAAVAAAADALKGPWQGSGPAMRARAIGALADLLEANAQEFAEIEAFDTGKPIRQALAVDIGGAVEMLRYYSGWPTKLTGQTIPTALPARVYTNRRPVGVCALVIPWNFPLLTTTTKLAPALAAGCTVVLKPAEQASLSTLRLAELADEAGIPPGVVNVITGDGRTGAALVRHSGVDKVSFTGSTSVGREIGAECGRSLKRVTLELGGKAPNVIFDDADIKAAVKGAFIAGFYNSGQVCQAGARLFVQRGVFDEVVTALGERAGSSRLGAATDPSTQMGPLVSKEHHDRVWSYIDAGHADGAEAVVGGRGAPVPERGYFAPPTLFVGADEDASIVRDEIFGPVVAALPFDDIDEVIARANHTEYGLTAYAWTRDIGKAHRMADALEAGSVFINMANAADAAAPFGGVKASGIGRESGPEGVEAFLESKTVWIADA